MAHKSDDGQPTPNTDEPADGVDGEEFDDCETSEVTKSAVDAASNDRDGANFDEQSPDEEPDAEGASPDQGELELPDAEALEPGTILGHRYQIVSLVHSGGMGHVYKAIDSRRHSSGAEQVHVAIKTIRRSVAAQLDAPLALEREAATAQRLSHPNIINIYDFNEHEGQFYLIIEWLDGETVLDLLRRTRGRRVAQQFAWQVIQGIATAVSHAHSHGVVHADINPSNVFITDIQEVKLLDFGVARIANGMMSATGDDSVWATRNYASPEVLSGMRPVVEDDIFSLACIAYRLLSGIHPFGGRPSIDAEQEGLQVRQIPDLSDADWQTLQSALSYSRSERPRSADVFLRSGPAQLRPSIMERVRPYLPADLRSAVPLGALVLVVGAWWLSAQGPSEDVASTATPASEADAVVDSSMLNVLLTNAQTAMEDERLVAPADNNARTFYRTVLTLDPTNAVALSGLRRISDVFVQQADAALRSDAPASASAALAIAAETDPENPAIAIVNELLRAQGNRLLADARLAADTGDEDRAAHLLFEAERYEHIDPAAIDVVRDRITESVLERQFLSRLSAAEAHMAAGRLTIPVGNNAHAALIALVPQHGDDPRLRASMERLGERLLTRAAFATAAGEFTEAGRLLDATDTLGVLTPEVVAARTSLESAANRDAAATEEGVVTGESSSAEAELTGLAAGALATLPATTEDVPVDPLAVSEDAPDPALAADAESTPATDTASTGSVATLPVSDETLSGFAAAVVPESGIKIEEEPDKEPQFTTLQELGIEEYVAPRFPPRAERLGRSGFVEVRFQINVDGSTGDIEILRSEPGNLFVSSARKAVEQWRFPTRDEALTTQLRMSFELAAP